MPLDAARDGLIAVQGQLLVMLAQRNAGLEVRVSEMEDRLARLERALSRNSGNSSMPPSSDDQPGKTPPAPKPKRGNGKKRQGKQRGAPGAHLAWSEDPDRRHDLFPQGACGCGRDLGEAEDLGIAASRQVIDTPVVTADLRPSKTQQKISGRLRSETATRHRYAIRGYFDTARKHGQPVMTVIRDALTGNPWMPAVPCMSTTMPAAAHTTR